MATFTYTKPTVGGSEDTWGTTLNANWDALGTFLGSLDSAELAVLDGITSTTAELNLLDGITSSTAELNLLDGVTATTTEINYLSGVTGPIQAQIASVVPSGAVFHFAMSTAPSGYLAADGAAVSRTTYAALFAAIGTTYGSGNGSTTFNLPDLRAEFIRGWDDGRGVDTGRGFGTSQTDEFKSHTHTGTNPGGIIWFTRFQESGGNWPSAKDGNTRTGSTDATGGTETRPRNIALLACIKY